MICGTEKITRDGSAAKEQGEGDEDGDEDEDEYELSPSRFRSQGARWRK